MRRFEPFGASENSVRKRTECPTGSPLHEIEDLVEGGVAVLRRAIAGTRHSRRTTRKPASRSRPVQLDVRAAAAEEVAAVRSCPD